VWGGDIVHVALLGKRHGKSCGQPGRDEHCISVEEARASHPSSMGNRSEAGGLDVSEGNPSRQGRAAVGVRIGTSAVVCAMRNSKRMETSFLDLKLTS
jgi:hypothetical protein